jgi:hypothetical protein
MLRDISDLLTFNAAEEPARHGLPRGLEAGVTRVEQARRQTQVLWPA